MSSTRYFQEVEASGHGMLFQEDRVLVDRQTPYQHIRIFEGGHLGRVMVLDGAMMLTERHEFVYHEMLVHPALFAHPAPKRVLVIGGGDGGTLREVCRHPEVEEAVLCEIDEEVIALSKEFIPSTAVGLSHEKATVFVGDGLEYLRGHKNDFDAIFVDSTDPVGFAEGLFRRPFYEDVVRALRPGGILVQQSESPFLLKQEWWAPTFQNLKQVFSKVHAYGASIPMYPTGYWTFAFSSNDTDPWAHFDPRRADAMEGLRYYHKGLQQAAFVLPKFAMEILNDVDHTP